MHARMLLVAASLLLAGSTAVAQQTANRHNLTFRGAPGNVTRGFLVTEFGVADRLQKYHGFTVSHATWDVGYMRNVGRYAALGATVFLFTDDHFEETYFLRLKPRVRTWLWRRLHADLSAGVVFAELGGRDIVNYDLPSIVGHVGVGYGDWASIMLQYENMHFAYDAYSFPPAGGEQIWYFGASVGSYAGAAMAPLALAAVIIVRNLNLD